MTTRGNGSGPNPYYMNPTLPVSMYNPLVTDTPQKKRSASISFTPTLAPTPTQSSYTFPTPTTKRVWVKTATGTPTTIIVHDTDIVDDLKLAVLAKFPNTLGRFVDLADLSIKIDFATLRKDDDTKAAATSAPKYLHLEPDQSVYAILDSYYAQGMTMADALIVDPVKPAPALAAAAAVYHQKKFHAPQPQVAKLPITTLPQPHPLPQRLNLPQRQALPDVRELPGTQLPQAVPPPTLHRRLQLIPPQSPASLSLAVLLLPKNFTLNGDEKKKPAPEKPKEQPEKKSVAKSNTDRVLPLILVLVVEDNAINQAILGAFLRKHKIHYQIAKNGQEAIDKWRAGGFHLVLIDIQLPVKLGIEATKEIRRLERINRIGVFAQEWHSHKSPVKPEERLDLNLFRAPVIIVALTALLNSLVDRQNALMAGCNDYLTKPVNLVWLQNKITEWGCMQALIDFDWWKSKRTKK